MATAQPEPGTFPTAVDDVPRTEQIWQCFGWLYGYLGVLAITASVAAAFGGAWEGFHNEGSILGLLTGLALAGPVLLWWEFRRRARRTVLVPRGGVIGIYRRRQFAQTMELHQMKVRRFSRFSTIRTAILLPLCLGYFLVTPLIDRSYWPLAVVGLLLLIGGISGVRTRFMLDHCIIPGAKYEQDLLLDKADTQRLRNIGS